jgi:hypothetical protein
MCLWLTFSAANRLLARAISPDLPAEGEPDDECHGNEGQNDGYERTSVPCRTPIYARVCVPGVEPVLPGPRSVIGRSYSARLALLVVWGAGEAVVFATSVTILLTP